jgi:hypothetical protein
VGWTPKKKALAALGGVAAVLAGVLVFVIASRDDEEPATGPTTTTVPEELRFWPLTHLAAEADDPIDRPVVAVKVSNSPDAHPQVGLDAADVVIELRVEGITRFLALFQSTAAAPVGPIRSARDSDIDLLASLGRPVFVWGGANEGVAARVGQADLVSYNVDPDAAEDKFRDPDREAPNNLFIDSTDAFWDKAEDASPGRAPFTLAALPDVLPGAPGNGAVVDFDGTEVTFSWDAEAETYTRNQAGQGDSVTGEFRNVLILATTYGAAPSDSRSPDAITTGTGDATVLLGGNTVDATWSRPTPSDPYSLVDDATGQPLTLIPGRTFIALPQPGTYRRL